MWRKDLRSRGPAVFAVNSYSVRTYVDFSGKCGKLLYGKDLGRFSSPRYNFGVRPSLVSINGCTFSPTPLMPLNSSASELLEHGFLVKWGVENYVIVRPLTPFVYAHIHLPLELDEGEQIFIKDFIKADVEILINE